MRGKKVLETVQLTPGQGGVTAPQGFTANGISCGVKTNGHKDLCIIYSRDACSAAAVFTTNRVKAAPLKVSKANLNKKIHAIVCNSGNANACTGRQGLKDARTIIKRTAELFDLPPNSVLVASTGVIGVNMPMEVIEYGIEKLKRKLVAENNVLNAADSILTTDTKRKMAKVTCVIGGKTVTIGGIAKGSGMINPNLATMLCFLTTDCNISTKMLQRALRTASKHTFNKISVDGQMSTNDTVFLLANGRSNNPPIARPGANSTIFEAALERICEQLAMDVVNDGEGITKVITITVKGATKKADAEKIAREIGDSPLVKTAFYGQSANWGRIMQAIGASDVPVNPDRVSITLNGTLVCDKGVSCGLSSLEGRALLNRRNIEVLVDLGLGSASDWIVTTDLTYDYVKINASYT